ncbi:very-long-chain (3R)-3-hydroxyacyl-CoA dehydratase 3-like isoform X2 [Biomphalaria glabrata]|uniref:Very-long-chain (3R)-3-hydroxyacyl-CoA dehydratase n=1 Tax=Biomphalaria glabrata TaxID=6526 RepID=A0A9W3B235_BIOGL|nr:very-long-chain (3R)-3-hydroxyacyl-CoA dehydratase 3-like isoform X2 [Biomphalaria glabrata]
MSTSLSPFVYWGQTNAAISLKVDLRNVENVEVSLTEENLDFSAQGLGVKGVNLYNFHIDFYLPVDPKKSRYRKTDLAVEFQIEKSVAETWPRLTAEKLKLPWLKIDFDKFPSDDSEEQSDDDVSSMNMKQTNEEMLNKLTAELSSTDPMDIPSPKLTYLFTYNLIQFVGYAYVFVSLLYHHFKSDETAKQAAFEEVGTQMMFCQALSCMEIVHTIFKLVHSQVLITIFQVTGRNFILFMLILQEPRLQISPLCWYLFLTWSCIEIIRYPFYMMQLVNFELKFLTWLRYSVWIILYPLGILIEATIVFQSITYFSETGFFSIALPNSVNFAFYFPYFLIVYLVAMCFGSNNNLKYLYIQRQKQLGKMSQVNGKSPKQKTS